MPYPEISKKLTLEFYYNVCKLKQLGEGQIQTYYGGTDSLLLKVKTDNLLDDLENGKHIRSRRDYTNWDESIYPELAKRQAPNQLLFLKSETGSDLISHGVLAGPKVYCVQTHDEDIKVCKGVPSHNVKENFNMSVYRNCVENNLVPRAKVIAIRSLIFKYNTVRVEKNTISTISDKVHIYTAGVKVLSHGHYITSY